MCTDIGLRLFELGGILDVEIAVGIFIPSPAEVIHDSHIELIHLADQFAQVLGRHTPLMVMDVDKRVFGPGNDMLWHDQGRFRVVFFEIHLLCSSQQAHETG